MKKVKKILKISIMVVALAAGFIGLPALADDKACTIDPNNPA